MNVYDNPYLIDFFKDGKTGMITVKNMSGKSKTPKHIGNYIDYGNPSGFIPFSLTDVLWRFLDDPAFIEAIDYRRKVPDHYVQAQAELLDYLERGDYSVLHLEYKLGRLGASYPIIASDKKKRYCCENIIQVVFSIVHYCISESYQFGKCAHCGKWFARKTKKIEYCYGQSPVILGNKNYTHLHCADAVKNLRQQLRRIREQIQGNYNAAGDLESTSQYASVFEEKFGSKYCIRGMKKQRILRIVMNFLKKNCD